MIMFGSFLPSLGWLAPPKFTRAWEPTLLWNHYHSLTVCGCPYFRYSDSSSASQSASARLLWAPRIAAFAVSPVHDGRASLCVHRIRECATNHGTQTSENRDDGKASGIVYSGV